MTEIVGMDNAKIVSARLREARLGTGLSTRAVAEQIGAKFNFAISYVTIAKYERPDGNSSPPVKVLGMLSELYERPIQWFLQTSSPLIGIRYRYTSSRVLVKERHQYESQAQHWLEAYAKLERRLGDRLVPARNISKHQSREPVELAAQIRRDLDIKDKDPIFTVVGIMEEFGVRVIELPTDFRIDGLTARFGDETAVVLNPATSNDRCRLNSGHELFHALSGDCDKAGNTTKEMEDRAYEFACNLLIPTSELAKAFEGRSAVRLVQAKERFGISMAAMIYRAEKLQIIDARTAKKLWIQFAKRGWRSNEPGSVRPDRAIRFETMLDRALVGKKIQWSEACMLMGVKRSDLEERMKHAMGCVANGEEDQQKGGPTTLRLRDDQ